MENGWTFLVKGYVKVNVHAFNLDAQLPNNNDYGIGIVIMMDMGLGTSVGDFEAMS